MRGATWRTHAACVTSRRFAPEGLIIRVFRMRFGPDRNVRLKGVDCAAGSGKPRRCKELHRQGRAPTLRVEPLISAALAAWSEGRITFGDREHNARKQANRLRARDAEGWTEIQHITRGPGCPLQRPGRGSGVVQGRQGDPGAGDPKTIETLLAQFRSFLAWCVDSGLIQFNAAATIRGGKRSKKRGPQTRSGMRALYEDEPLRLIAAAEADEPLPNPAVQQAPFVRLQTRPDDRGRKGQLTLSPAPAPSAGGMCASRATTRTLCSVRPRTEITGRFPSVPRPSKLCGNGGFGASWPGRMTLCSPSAFKTG